LQSTALALGTLLQISELRVHDAKVAHARGLGVGPAHLLGEIRRDGVVLDHGIV
jgi:hypothetical protein